MRCSFPGCDRDKILARGLCGKHYQAYRCRLGKVSGREYGPCPTCKQNFRSNTPKTFCCFQCYLSSDLSKDILANARVLSDKATGRQSGLRFVISCLHCGKERSVLPCQSKPRNYKRPNGKVKRCTRQKFCSRSCMRSWLSIRFDNFVANPQSIALPQCYDEFLSQAELPCLIEGCDWVGHNLSSHVNLAHGITAEKFKEMAGFNHTTGVISATHNKTLVEAHSERGNPNINDLSDIEAIKKPRGPLRLEGREHHSKAVALRMIERRGKA